MHKVFVTGAAGFIGSNLAEALLDDGAHVVGWDNFSTGRREFLENARKQPHFELVEGDNLDLAALTAAMEGCEVVFHLAANADVRFGLEHPSKDFEQNTRATFHVLEAMRANSIRQIAFSSTGSVYGEAQHIPTPEDHPFPVQTSLYGASKLAGEGLIEAYAEGFEIDAYIFRFVSILGPRYTHGHVFDFCAQLMEHKDYLDVLGDGYQRKSYLHVSDCARAMLHVIDREEATKAPHRTAIFNLGADEYCTVRESVGWICERLGVSPKLKFSGGRRGWIGDNPLIWLDTSKIRATGWQPQHSIREGVETTLDWLCANSWVFPTPAIGAFPPESRSYFLAKL
jgi:UDP-glucose 4-epimerase